MKHSTRRMAVLAVMLMVAGAACSDTSGLEAEIDTLESQIAALETANATLEADVGDLEDLRGELETSKEALEAEKEALEAAIASTAQTLVLQADIVGEGCMLQNAYVNDGEAKATFRVRVYDPATGEQMGEDLLESVTVTLGDGQEFVLSWGPHPPNTEDDFFWTYGWEIFEGYPAGNIPYTITAVAKDGRTGEFEPFNVAPSLLTVIDANAVEA